jgi:FkbM family methyltransferase
VSIFRRIKFKRLKKAIWSSYQAVGVTLQSAQHIRALRLTNYCIDFTIEKTRLKVPEISLLDLLVPRKRKEALMTVTFSQRPMKEALLRTLIKRLLDSKALSTDDDLIDIGCYLGDNAIAWAQLLSPPAAVWAIDPSPANIAFAKQVAKLNSVTNLQWIRAICSDRAGLSMQLIGDLEHGRFKPANSKSSSRSFYSTTLDKILTPERWSHVGLIHVDVEGMELEVLTGAKEIITRSTPIILFEHHISTYDLAPVCQFLSHFRYTIYMINEILPGCNPDCRNFIASVNRGKLESIIDTWDEELHDGGRHGIYYATTDCRPALKVNLPL